MPTGRCPVQALVSGSPRGRRTELPERPVHAPTASLYLAERSRTSGVHTAASDCTCGYFCEGITRLPAINILPGCWWQVKGPLTRPGSTTCTGLHASWVIPPDRFLVGRQIETVSQWFGVFTGVVPPRQIRTIPPTTPPPAHPRTANGRGEGGERGGEGRSEAIGWHLWILPRKRGGGAGEWT